MFSKANQRFYKDLDLISLLKFIGYSRIMQKVIFSQRSRLLLKFQNRQVLNQTSSSDSEDLDNQFSDRMHSQNQFVKLGAFLKIRKLLNEYSKMRISAYDKNLILGMFKHDQKQEVLTQLTENGILNESRSQTLDLAMNSQIYPKDINDQSQTPQNNCTDQDLVEDFM